MPLRAGNRGVQLAVVSTTQLRKQLDAVLGDSYVIERELDAGGMSRVFVARETALGRDIVIKVLAPELAGSVSGERFRREIELAARLQHPNIVPLLSAGEAHGLPYYTMPFVAGESLRTRIARAAELPIADAVAVLRDLARALAYAHGRGIVHRDIKPDNVLLAHDYAVVTDFGVAKALNDAITQGGVLSPLTSTGVALGTPAYMAPEQSAADPGADHRVDIYAFGVVAYEVLTGMPPFAARNPQAVIAAHATEAPAAVTVRRPSTPPQLAAIVMRCLAKRPADRPQTADEIVRALDAIATSPADGAAVPVPRSATVPTWRSRRGLLTLGAIAAAIVAVAALGAFLARKRAAPGVDHNLVAVLPFRIVASDPSLRSLREGMPDLVAAKLTGAVRAIDTRTMLAAWHRAGGTVTADPDRSTRIAVARSLGAGRFLEGDVVQAGATLTISGALVDVAAPEHPYQASVAGPTTAVAALVDTLIARLIALGAGVREQDVGSLAGIPLPALQAYLAGQEAYRAGQYARAAEMLSQALAVDSTFAQAGLRLYLAGSWIDDDRAEAGRLVAQRYRDRLSQVDQLILQHNVNNPSAPRSCADSYEAAERAVRTAPDVPELWYEVADDLFHCGEAIGITAARRRALQGFERALALDSAFAPALEHLPQLYTELGDTAAARRAMARFPDTSDSRIVMRYFLAEPKDRDAALRELARHAGAATAQVAIFAADIGGPFLDGADTMMAALNDHAVTEADRRRVAAVARIVALTRGQPQRAARALSALAPPPGVAVLDALFGDGDSAAAVRAIPLAQRDLAIPAAPDTAQDHWMTNVYAAAQYGIAAGSLDAAQKASALLHSFRPTSSGAFRSRRALDLALLLDAQIAVLGKRPDAMQRTIAADSMLRRADGGEFVISTGNPVVARLWERLGDVRHAYAASQRFRYNANLMAYFATSIRERARLAAAAGDTADAVRQYRRYVAMRAKPEPVLLPALESARAELARLEKSTSGK